MNGTVDDTDRRSNVTAEAAPVDSSLHALKKAFSIPRLECYLQEKANWLFHLHLIDHVTSYQDLAVMEVYGEANDRKSLSQERLTTELLPQHASLQYVIPLCGGTVRAYEHAL